MERYSVISSKFPRELLLLQGTGCRWGRCIFCDYHNDRCDSPFETNRAVLERVSGCHGVLDIINSGSAMELDSATIALIKKVVQEKNIHTLWFEAHYRYRHQLQNFAAQFAPVIVKFRCGVETFDPILRDSWHKGIPTDVSADDIAQYFHGVCLLCCTQGETIEHIQSDIAIAIKQFEYISINLFCNNSTPIKRDDALTQQFEREIYPQINKNPKIEILINNNDLGVG